MTSEPTLEPSEKHVLEPDDVKAAGDEQAREAEGFDGDSEQDDDAELTDGLADAELSDAGDEQAASDPATDPEAPAEPALPTLGPGEELSDEELDRQLLGVLFASSEALSEAKLIELLDRPSKERVAASLERAQRVLVDSPLPVLLERVGGGWRLLTDPALGDVLRRAKKDGAPEKLSGAALETLAIVAYRQPVTKAEVEAIRGVQSGTLLRALVDRRLARVVGRADQPGAPLLYGTTKDFLDRFGLESLKALPRDGELVR